MGLLYNSIDARESSMHVSRSKAKMRENSDTPCIVNIKTSYKLGNKVYYVPPVSYQDIRDDNLPVPSIVEDTVAGIRLFINDKTLTVMPIPSAYREAAREDDEAFLSIYSSDRDALQKVIDEYGKSLWKDSAFLNSRLNYELNKDENVYVQLPYWVRDRVTIEGVACLVDGYVIDVTTENTAHIREIFGRATGNNAFEGKAEVQDKHRGDKVLRKDSEWVISAGEEAKEVYDEIVRGSLTKDLGKLNAF